jgi:hypothetical protein
MSSHPWHRGYDSAEPMRRRLIQRTPDEPTSREIWLTVAFIIIGTLAVVATFWRPIAERIF